jgi:ADP-dependent phosphofructokinase/glucokinase
MDELIKLLDAAYTSGFNAVGGETGETFQEFLERNREKIEQFKDKHNLKWT